MAQSNTAPRLFVPDDLREGAQLAATPAQAHHLGTVLRQAPGAVLRLFNGRDGEWAVISRRASAEPSHPMPCCCSRA